MIVPMKKVTVVLTEDTRKASLKSLRKAGVLHLERDPGTGKASDEMIDEASFLEQALLALPKVKPVPHDGSVDRSTARREAEEIISLKDREKSAYADLLRYAADMETLAPWGDFEPAELAILAAKGIDIRLVSAEAAAIEAIEADQRAFFITIRKSKGTVYGALVYPGDAPDDGISGINIPENGLSELSVLIEERKAELNVIESELKAHALASGSLEAAYKQVRQEIEFEEVRDSLAGEEGLAWFSGYIPSEDIDKIKSLAAGESWGLMIADPEPDDPVPSLVRNRPAIRIIQPVFDLMGIYPGYHESDISFWFLTFLSIFVAMILGDAAYGLIILTLVLVFRIKTGKPSDALKLFAVFGLTTFIWGAVTGTWFSSLALVRDTPLKMLVIPAVATYQNELFPGYTASISLFPGDTLDATAMVKWISLLFGVLMLSIARIQSFIRKLPTLAALAQLGWLSIVLALYWLIMQLVLQLTPLPFITDLILPMILGGLASVVIFGGQEKGRSFVKGVLEGLKDILPTSLNAIGAFGDIISFIRLFAVGLAGVALSQSFNGMAPKGGGFSIIAAILILVFGHTLNLGLNALSVLVHGVRLNVLEFSGHLDMEWAGIGFDPFRLRVPEAETPETDKE